MRLVQSELSTGITKISLTGALDIAGAGEIEAPFAAISSRQDKVIVDFSGVTFLASIGIRILVKAARAIVSRKGRLVVFNASPDARKVLRSTGLDTIVPVVADEAAAVSKCLE